MKKSMMWLSALVLMVCAMTFTACGDDDKVSPSLTTADLAGTWQTTRVEYALYENGTLADQGVETDLFDRLIITTDGHFTYMEYSDYSGQYHADGTGTFARRGDTWVVSTSDWDEITVVSVERNQIVIDMTLNEQKGDALYVDKVRQTFARIN